MKKRSIVLVCFFAISIISSLMVSASSPFYISAGGNDQLTLKFLPIANASFSGEIPAQAKNKTTQNTGGNNNGGSTNPATPSGPSLTVSLTNITEVFAIGESVEKDINVTNLGGSAVNVSITQNNITNFTFIKTPYLYLQPGQTGIARIAFVSNNQTGTFNGSITIGGIKVPVSLQISKIRLLFDIGLSILNPGRVIIENGTMNALITMVPQGSSKRIDVKLEYIIENNSNTVFFDKIEEVLVQNQKSIRRNFNLTDIPPGNYKILVRMTYPGGTAISSSRFVITASKSKVIAAEIVYYAIVVLVSMSIITLIVLIILLIRENTNIAKRRIRDLKLKAFANATFNPPR